MSVAKAELAQSSRLPIASFGDRDRRIEEELDRVVAGLAMDLDGAREVGRALVVVPIVVGEPGRGRPRAGSSSPERG